VIARIACAALAAVALGCTFVSIATAPHIGACEGPLVDVAAIPGGDFQLRERVHFAGQGVDLALELLAERRGDRLVVIGFNAFGARVFSLVQRGREVERDAPLGRALAIAPENALFDLHEARFFHPESGGRVEVHRRGCDYTATFVRVEQRPLSAPAQ
jgi:hypothetical protein